MLKLLFQTLYYPYSQIWKLYIGHLEFVPRMKRPVWRRDTMETISRKSPEYNWLQCTQEALILPFSKAFLSQAWKA